MIFMQNQLEILLIVSAVVTSSTGFRKDNRFIHIPGRRKLTKDVLRKILNPAVVTLLSSSFAEYRRTWEAALSNGLHSH